MTVSRILTNICSDCLSQSRDFYVSLLDLHVNYDSDWYVQLSSPSDSQLELGIILRDSELVPTSHQTAPTGLYITFVVDDVDQTYAKAKSLGLRIVQEPRNEFYGQRRFLTIDPNGCLLDIGSPWSDVNRASQTPSSISRA
jgi:catechol 2,3-dioxygenase-like lactoylglutathione lyase family enzyme